VGGAPWRRLGESGRPCGRACHPRLARTKRPTQQVGPLPGAVLTVGLVSPISITLAQDAAADRGLLVPGVKGRSCHGGTSRPLRFGVQLQAQRTSWQEYVAALRSVEELGFDSAWTCDHLLPFSGPDDGPCFDALTTLAAMATLTSRVRIGSW